MIYLDYSANTPSCEEVLLSFLEAERNFPGNANSDHTPGRQAKAEMARITSSVSDMLGVRANEVIFTFRFKRVKQHGNIRHNRAQE